MLLLLLFFSFLHSTVTLRLTYCPMHLSTTTDNLHSKLSTSIHQLKQLQSAIDNQLNTLDPYNQTKRIYTLQQSIIKDRQKLFEIYRDSLPSLSGMTYYCQKINSQEQENLTQTLDSLTQQANKLGQINAIQDQQSSLKATPSSLTQLTQKIGQTLQSPGITLTSQPKQKKILNPTSNNWFVSSSDPSAINQHYQRIYGTNQVMCPSQYPYVDQEGRCMNCPHHYNLQMKRCQICNSFNQEQHTCQDLEGQEASGSGKGNQAGTTGSETSHPSSGVTYPSTKESGNHSTSNPSTSPSQSGVTSPTTSPKSNESTSIPSSNNESTSNPTPINQNSSTSTTEPDSTIPAAPTHRITNPNTLQKVLLPEGQTIQSYKQNLTLQSLQPNTSPCPSTTPFFDGTKCIECPQGQYFSIEISTCQTCPATQIYDPSTYHCVTTHFYSNPQANQWVSIATPPDQIKKQNRQTEKGPDSKPCPKDRPFFNGKDCIACSGTSPLFSYDALKCTACSPPTVFDPADNACVSPISMQTNPLSSNLIYGGRSLNEWQSYYYNNQTVNPQLAECPSVRPFFDGVTCITCPENTPYFNLQVRECQNCPALTSYDQNTHECLSTSGNIVTQSPTITKMAAGIFG